MIRLFNDSDLWDLVELSREQAVPTYTDVYDREHHVDYCTKIITACNQWKRKNYGHGYWENDELKAYLFATSNSPYPWSNEVEAVVTFWYSKDSKSKAGMKLFAHFEKWANEAVKANYIVLGSHDPLLHLEKDISKGLPQKWLDKKGYVSYNKSYRKRII